MTISLKTIALLTPSFTTLFWAIILYLRNRSARNPGFFIALLMISFFFLFTSILPYFTANLNLYLVMEPVFFLGLCMIFPLIYLYIRSVTCRLGFRKKDIGHIIPALFFLIVSAILHSLISKEELEIYAYHDNPLHEAGIFLSLIVLINYLSKIIVLVQILYYFFKSHQLIRIHRKQVNDYFSGLNKFYFNWIRIFYITYPGASILGLYLLLSGNKGIEASPDIITIITFFSLSAVFFMIAYIANHQKYIENGEFYIEQEHFENVKTGFHIPKDLKNELDKYFENEKPFLNPELKITDVASKLKSNRTYISTLIKEEYHKNFSGFVNAYRVREAISLFSMDKYRNYTSKSLSESVGFNNYNSYVQAFRDETGMTPAKYREKLPENGSDI